MHDTSWLDSARGYIDLGMLDDAWEELEKLSPDLQELAPTIELRIVIRLDQENYPEAFALCEALTTAYPNLHSGFVQGGFCLHAAGETAKAVDFLQSGPASLKDEPVYYYNLACYEVALGRSQAALTWLKRSIKLNPRNRAIAKADPDLAPLVEQLEETSERA
ncbi:MAG: tetratricopeptide repeat protein [Verrucomicrobiota bacterium]